MKSFYEFYQQMLKENPIPGQQQPGQQQPGQQQPGQQPGMPKPPIQGGQTSPPIGNPIADPKVQNAIRTLGSIKDPIIQQALQQFQKSVENPSQNPPGKMPASQKSLAPTNPGQPQAQQPQANPGQPQAQQQTQ